MRFALLLYADPDRAAVTTEDEAVAELRRYQELTEAMIEAGAFVAGEAFMPGTGAIQVGSMATSTDGAVGADLELSGYYVVECDDADQAVRLAERIPVTEHGVVEVRPIMDFPDS